jgi:hypothetical protein
MMLLSRAAGSAPPPSHTSSGELSCCGPDSGEATALLQAKSILMTTMSISTIKQYIVLHA